MRQRCNDPNYTFYFRYGGRGIGYDPAWDDFAVFFRDMGERPPGMTLERKRNEEDYSKDNCRWATPQEQAQNRRSNRVFELHGETLCLAEVERRYGVTRHTLYRRLRNGYSIEEAVQPGYLTKKLDCPILHGQ